MIWSRALCVFSAIQYAWIMSIQQCGALEHTRRHEVNIKPQQILLDKLQKNTYSTDPALIYLSFASKKPDLSFFFKKSGI